MVLDAGKSVMEADAEFSEAIDFADYYARSFSEEWFDGTRFTPLGTVLITPPWNFPFAIPCGGILAAMVAGNTVILKPAPETVLTAWVLVNALWDEGIPREALQFLPCPDNDIGHAGQKCSAASLVIVEAEVYDDPAFRRRLRDAAASLAVGGAWNYQSLITPLIREPGEALARALTHLDPGEEWLLEPRIVNENPNLWSPGIKLGVNRDSWFRRNECFGPVLGLIRAKNLSDAVRIQNDSDFEVIHD